MFTKTLMIATTAAVLGAGALPAAANHDDDRNGALVGGVLGALAGASIAESRDDDRRHADRYDRRYYDANGRRYGRGGAPAYYDPRANGNRGWRPDDYRGGTYYRDGKHYRNVEEYLDSRRGDGG